MARTKTKYSATFIKNEETIMTDVIMTALPYGEFGPENPLLIIDNVDMGKGKKAPLPDFSHVIIDGTFDCSDYTINETSVLPTGITELICLYSINSLSALIGKLPQSVMQVTVRPAILNAIKKNLDEHKEVVNQFIEQYPDVITTDGKQTLTEILMLNELSKPAQKTTTMAEQQTNKPTTPIKTSDWLSTDEVINICTDLSEELAALTQQELTRYVQMARSSKSNLNLRCQKMLRDDGVEITCIHNNEISKVIDFISTKVAEAQEQKIEKPKEKKIEKEQPKQTNIPEKTQPATQELQVIKINKFITKAAWKKIRAKWKNNVGAMLSALRDIEVINVNPTDTQGGKVQYVEDGVIKTSANIVLKNSNYLAQEFGILDNNNARIIWTIYGNTFVCQHFLKTHMDPKSNAKYKQIIRSKPVELSDQEYAKLLSVTELIKELEDGRGDATPPLDELDEDNEDDHDDIDATEAPKETNASVDAMVDMDAQKAITEAITPETPVVDITPVKPTTEETTKRTKNPVAQQKTWQALYSMHVEFHTTIDKINLRQKEIAEALLVEETEASLQLTDELQQLLKKKLAYEEALKKFREATTYMHEIQQQFKTK